MWGTRRPQQSRRQGTSFRAEKERRVLALDTIPARHFGGFARSRRFAQQPDRQIWECATFWMAVLLAVLDVLFKYASARRPARASYPQPSHAPRYESVCEMRVNAHLNSRMAASPDVARRAFTLGVYPTMTRRGFCTPQLKVRSPLPAMESFEGSVTRSFTVL